MKQQIAKIKDILRKELDSPLGPDMLPEEIDAITGFDEIPHGGVTFIYGETELFPRWYCPLCDSTWIKVGPAAYQNTHEGDGWVFCGKQLPGECDCK